MSERFKLNKEDIKKWLKNAAIFLAPAALVFLAVLETGGTIEEGLIALKLWGINVLIDLIRKFLAGAK
jgi:hypothetical protein